MNAVQSFRVLQSYHFIQKHRLFSTLKNIPSVYIEQVKLRLVESGNPLIFSGAVQKVDGNPKAGDEVNVVASNETVVARGLFNPHSQYRIRILATQRDSLFHLPMEDLIAARIEQSIKMRIALSLPSTITNSFRLINGEGDFLSGLMVDVFHQYAVIQSSAYWVEKHKLMVERAVYRSLSNHIPSCKVIWKPNQERLKQDGYDISVINTDETAGSKECQDVVISENSINYYTSPLLGQKTGFYFDQRDSRKLISTLCANKSVLDLYCYTGGFALNALYGKANNVTAVDSSKFALDTAKRNVKLNKFDENSISFIEDDCVDAMKNLLATNKTFDVIICDPPKLAPTRATLQNAKIKYQRINTLAMKLVNPNGGLLLTCTCSGAMTQSDSFINTLQQAAQKANRILKVLSISNAAKDHPVLASFTEGHYLTAVLLYVV